ncbi:universal stress protein [Solirubrobacter ginsenosidimutans]|uniref:Universal stress protein n=1 Tax=Solirubrobacter ginsenosidimutans TaxID=490573 RepID=A0A9X3S439_9ACTN|nr:universal stress protein [Solirubrobacter ginsenosidimutans]MDA0162736.1 universal stress protein [Solirubrobacter ginsenosidimutans]
MARDLKVLAWITESGWEACVDAVARLEPTEVTLMHVATTELPGPRGRRHEQVMARMADLAGEAAQALLDDAVERLDQGGVTIFTLPESGWPEDVVMQAAAEADLLVLTRDNRHPGPHSIEHASRFVVDHAPCDVLVVWPGGGPDGPPPKPKPKPKPGAKPKPKPKPEPR